MALDGCEVGGDWPSLQQEEPTQEERQEAADAEEVGVQSAEDRRKNTQEQGGEENGPDGEVDFPKSLLKRLVKEKLEDFLPQHGVGEKERSVQDVQVNKESLLAFNEAAKLFIYYVTSTANDLCRESKRQTISAEDVFKGLGEVEFDEFVEPLRKSLQGESFESRWFSCRMHSNAC